MTTTYVLIVALIISVTHGKILQEDTSRSILMSTEPDPYLDTYLTTVTRMSLREIIALPQLSDNELLDQLARGYDSLPVMERAQASSNLFDSNYDRSLEEMPFIDNEWEELMDAGPTSINLMGVIMAIASRKDIALSPSFHYQLINYPNSFRATLMQAALAMQSALHTAHSSMKMIQVNMEQIPALLKTAIKLVTQGSLSLNQAMLPRTLESIRRNTNSSATHAQASSDRFVYLQNLLQEILLVTTLTNSEYRNKAEILANQSSTIQYEKQEVGKMVHNLRAEYQAAREALEKAQHEYHTAMMSVPGHGWNTQAWEFYKSQRPAETCWRNWIGRRKCRSLRDEQFQQYSAEARYKAEQALKILQAAEEKSNTLYNLQSNKQNQLQAIINNFANLNLRELSVNETIKMLLDTTEKVALLNSQWSRLSQFFIDLSISTERTQEVVLNNFLKLIDEVQLIQASMDPIDKVLFTELLVQSAVDIDGDSHLLYIMAKTYSDVSHKYMIDQIDDLATTLSLPSDAEREVYVKHVANKSQAISHQVKALATERQREYEMANLARQGEYTRFIEEGMMGLESNNLGNVGIGRR